MPRIIRVPPGQNHASLVPDLVENMILISYPGDNFDFHMRILLVAQGGPRWIWVTPTWDVQQTDLSDEDILPLVRGGSFPLANRPYFAFGVIDEERMADARMRALSLATVLGIANPQLWGLSSTEAGWVFADTGVA